MIRRRFRCRALWRVLSLAVAFVGFSPMAFADAPPDCRPVEASRGNAAEHPDTTVKMVTLLRRKDGMTMEAFEDYYESVHARIGEKYLAPHASRYFRRYLRPVAGPTGAAEDEERTYDVVMEIWFPDQEAFDAAMRDLSTAEAQAEIVADERKLFDRDYIHSYIVEERESCLETPTDAMATRYPTQQDLAATVARQDIEYLRRLYGHATDLIGQNTPEAVDEGLAIYRRIFTPDARISAHSPGGPPLTATGPEGWAEVVQQALSGFQATQHLIGSQVVDIESLPATGDSDSGRASMASHLQAWHHGHDDTLDIFIGIYHDRLRYVPGTGWQIEQMDLERISGEVRPPQPRS